MGSAKSLGKGNGNFGLKDNVVGLFTFNRELKWAMSMVLSILTFCSWFLKSSLTCYCPTYTGDQSILLSTQEKANKQTKKRSIFAWVPPFTNAFAKIWAQAASHTIKHWLLLVNLQLLPLHLKASPSTSAVPTTLLPLCLRVRLISHIPSAGHWQSRIPSQPHLARYSCVLSRVSGCCFWPWVLPMGFSRPVREGWGWATLLTTPLQA